MSDTVRTFTSALFDFGEDVQADGVLIVREVADTTAEAIVFGNAFGPGVPVDTGFTRASFRVGRNEPVEGPTTHPPTPTGRTPGSAPLVDANLDVAVLRDIVLGDTIYITTSLADVPEALETLGRSRRFGPHAGEDTAFIDPVETRFDAIVEDAAERVGWGR